jgi:hypothetical protein
MTVAREGPGRPLKFESVEELEVRINMYFDDCDKEDDNRKFVHGKPYTEEGKTFCSECFQKIKSRGCILVSGEKKVRRPYTITGLAVWLDTSRETLLDYQYRNEFSDTILRAKQRIENYAEESLYDGNKPTNGVKFSLGNNFRRWAEKTESKVTVDKDAAAELVSTFVADAAKVVETGADAPAGADQSPTGNSPGKDAGPVPALLPEGVSVRVCPAGGGEDRGHYSWGAWGS